MSPIADRLSRLEREARATATLNHPNILVVFEVGAKDGAPFVVSELLEGKTLRQVLAQHLTLRQALDYTTQIANGLAAAHEKGVVHRDLKPENLVVTRDGRVKILDFGLARLTPENDDAGSETRSVLTVAGTVLGTAGYMAPEQVRGTTVDARADIFSLGAVFYEMLAGRRAFRGETMAETLTSILKDDPPDVAGIAPGVPPGVARVLGRCLQKRPEDRFQSARDVVFALEAGAASDAGPRSTKRGPIGLIALATGAAAVGLVAGVLLARVGATKTVPSPKRLTMDFPAAAALSSDIYVPFALSPDGTTLAYVAGRALRPLSVERTSRVRSRRRSAGGACRPGDAPARRSRRRGTGGCCLRSRRPGPDERRGRRNAGVRSGRPFARSDARVGRSKRGDDGSGASPATIQVSAPLA